MTRRKSVALTAPTTIEEAVALLTRYAAISAGLDQIEVDRSESKAAIDAAADKLAAPMKEALKDMARQLSPWWAVAGAELTEGKRKSIELAGCQLGTRMTTPKLAYPGKEENAVALLKEVPWIDGFQFLREKLSLDKQGLLKKLALGDEDAGRLILLGFTRKQREEFFVDRVPPREPATEQVDDLAADEVRS
ncbi:host-nuclease inhibitor Gam family protein [Sphingomonas sp. SRS2]|uniref:host-nuclease inhibitor Gam family protein n=1 Tax=Sphingomonas sp. SRS2 TaxID=133190 RepID=UPI00069656FE|nr:host-nuclease inhibitor Gam family protein [Sphingomonas sp. SRS2]